MQRGKSILLIINCLLLIVSCGNNYKEYYHEIIKTSNNQRKSLCLPEIIDYTISEIENSNDRKTIVKLIDSTGDWKKRRTLFIEDSKIVGEIILFNGTNNLGGEYKITISVLYDTNKISLFYSDTTENNSKELIFKNNNLFYIFTNERFDLLSTNDPNFIIIDRITKCQNFTKYNSEDLRIREMLNR